MSTQVYRPGKPADPADWHRPHHKEAPSRISLQEWQELASLPALEAAITDLLVGDDWQDTADIWDRRD